MKANEIKEVLLNKLKGKECASYYTYSPIMEALDPYFRANGINTLQLNFSMEYSTITICLPSTKFAFCHFLLLTIKVKRARSTYHDTILDCDLYNWSFKDFDVYVNTFKNESSEYKEEIDLLETYADAAKKVSLCELKLLQRRAKKKVE